MHVFGRGKKQQQQPADMSSVSERLTSREGALEQKLKSLNQQILTLKGQYTKQRGATKENTKQRLLHLMRQRKTLESQLSMLSNQSMMVDNISFNTEMISSTMETMNAMSSIAKDSKKMIKETERNLERYEDFRYDMQELQELQEEVTSRMQESFGDPGSIDDADLEDEFRELETECLLDISVPAPAPVAKGSVKKEAVSM
ncbi:hypothetical protein P9112_007101 [Eukaryota sp. TZLM1-RC]